MLWQQVLVELAVQMSKPNYDTWFRETRLVSLDGALAVIAAPNPFTAEWLDTRCKPLIRKTLMGIIQRPIECQILPSYSAIRGKLPDHSNGTSLPAGQRSASEPGESSGGRGRETSPR